MKQNATPIAVPPAALILASSLFLGGCDEPPAPTPDTAIATPAPEAATASAEQTALMNAVNVAAEQQFRKLTAQAGGFSDAVDGLLAEPLDERLATAQLAWEHLYGSYNEARTLLSCRALADPLQRQRLDRTDPLPILPGYIDSLAAWPGSGLVNDVTVPLTREALLEQQGATSEAEASVGFQVLQFLLFGEPDRPRQASDFMTGTDAASEPQAPETDADASGSPQPDVEPRQLDLMPLEDQPARRRAFLRLVTSLLVEDLKLLAQPGNEWGEPGVNCPARAMAETTRRLIRLENLGDHDQVSGEYLAPQARADAMTHLWQGLTIWLAADGPLSAWAETGTPQAAAQLQDLDVPDAADIAFLQRLHAALTSITGGH